MYRATEGGPDGLVRGLPTLGQTCRGALNCGNQRPGRRSQHLQSITCSPIGPRADTGSPAWVEKDLTRRGESTEPCDSSESKNPVDSQLAGDMIPLPSRAERLAVRVKLLFGK